MSKQSTEKPMETLRKQFFARFFDPDCTTMDDPILLKLLNELEELEPLPEFDIEKGLKDFWATFDERKTRLETEWGDLVLRKLSEV